VWRNGPDLRSAASPSTVTGPWRLSMTRPARSQAVFGVTTSATSFTVRSWSWENTAARTSREAVLMLIGYGARGSAFVRPPAYAWPSGMAPASVTCVPNCPPVASPARATIP
jgi:hypothetical protein